MLQILSNVGKRIFEVIFPKMFLQIIQNYFYYIKKLINFFVGFNFIFSFI